MVTKQQVVTKKQQAARREFVKKAAYVAPVILTLAVAPSYAKAGSEKRPKTKKMSSPGEHDD
jgi:hypothetical protein